MQVTDQDDASLRMQLLNEFLCLINGRVESFRWMFPSTIQVATRQRATIIAIYDTVWIHHRHEFNNVLIPKHFCFTRIRISQELYGATHHPRAN